jgi:hypothetical protein
MFSIISKLKKKKKLKLNNEIISYIDKISEIIKSKKIINFSHSGHLGDLINSLPVIMEIAKKSECNLFINLYKKLEKKNVDVKLFSKEFFLTKESYNKLYPLLEIQPYLSKVQVLENDLVDIDLDYFRNLPINFNIDSVRWYSHITGIGPDLNLPYMFKVNKNNKYSNHIIFLRSLRRQNDHITYNFMDQYENLLFIGLYDEYLDLKKQITKLKFYECNDFLEMAEIINSCKLFVGNLSFGYTIAEALKTPRLLESYLDFPLVYPNGPKAHEFYFQTHFEDYVKKILKN